LLQQDLRECGSRNAECGIRFHAKAQSEESTQRREEMEWLRKKNSDVKPQKTLSSLKILYHSFLSVLSVVKNSCSVILNSFQNLVFREARVEFSIRDSRKSGKRQVKRVNGKRPVVYPFRGMPAQRRKEEKK